MAPGLGPRSGVASLVAMAACLQALPPTWLMRRKRHACCALQAAARQEPGHGSALHAPSPRTRQLQGLGEPARPSAALPEPGRGPTAQLRGQEAASSLWGSGNGAQPVARAEATAAPARQRRLQEAASSVAAESEEAQHTGRSRAWSEADVLACQDVLWRALGRRDLRTALQAADAAYAAGVGLALGQADALLQGSTLCPTPLSGLRWLLQPTVPLCLPCSCPRPAVAAAARHEMQGRFLACAASTLVLKDVMSGRLCASQCKHYLGCRAVLRSVAWCSLAHVQGGVPARRRAALCHLPDAHQLCVPGVPLSVCVTVHVS